MKKVEANPDEYIFKLRQNIKKSKLTEAGRDELNQAVDILGMIVSDWKNIKQAEGDLNGE